MEGSFANLGTLKITITRRVKQTTDITKKAGNRDAQSVLDVDSLYGTIYATESPIIRTLESKKVQTPNHRPFEVKRQVENARLITSPGS